MPDPSWNVANDDCGSLSGWTESSSGDADVTQVTEDSRSCFRFYSSGGANFAGLAKAFGTSFTAHTFQYIAKNASTASNASLERFYAYARDNAGYQNGIALTSWDNTTSRPDLAATIWAGVDTSNTIANWIEGTTSSWITYRTVVTGSGGTAHLFVDGFYFGSVSYGSGTNPSPSYQVNVIELGTYTNNYLVNVYVDKIQLSTTQKEATQTRLVRIQGADNINARMGSHAYGGAYIVGQLSDQIRYKSGRGSFDSIIPYCIPVVSSGHARASDVRIYDNSTTMALEKWPTF